MTDKMNYSTAIFLVPESGVRAIATTYEEIDLNQDTTKMKYSPAYLSGGRLPSGAVIFKTTDQNIKVDDFVIVPTDTRHGMTVNKVVAVDVEIDFTNDKECHWIVGTVDTHSFEDIRQQEEKLIISIKAGEVNQKQKDLSDKLMAQIGDNLPSLPAFGGTSNPETDVKDSTDNDEVETAE